VSAERDEVPSCGMPETEDGMIPDEAVEAAMSALGEAYGVDAYCRERQYVVTALEAAALHMLVRVHHHDIENHARSFNEGYTAAVTQGLADDPTLADDWLQEKIREAKAEGWDAVAESVRNDTEIDQRLYLSRRIRATNPYRSQP